MIYEHKISMQWANMKIGHLFVCVDPSHWESVLNSERQKQVLCSRRSVKWSSKPTSSQNSGMRSQDLQFSPNSRRQAGAVQRSFVQLPQWISSRLLFFKGEEIVWRPGFTLFQLLNPSRISTFLGERPRGVKLGRTGGQFYVASLLLKPKPCTHRQRETNAAETSVCNLPKVCFSRELWTKNSG